MASTRTAHATRSTRATRPAAGNVRRLPAKDADPKQTPGMPHKGPEVVVNLVEVTISLGSPMMFGVPLRLVDFVLERLGLVTKEDIARVVDPELDEEDAAEPVPTRRSQMKVPKAA